MLKSQSRLFEALNYGSKEKSKLTTKQYLVYSYLMSISKWNPKRREDHYYVYKNSFTVVGACKKINISQPTWRTAIEKLWKLGYIEDGGDYYEILMPEVYAPLDINLIRFLLPFGSTIQNGGNIISVYSIIYLYYYYCSENRDTCEITLNQLRKLFNERHDNDTVQKYRLMLSLFESYGLIYMKKVGRQYNGNPYTGYIIQGVRLDLPNDNEIAEEYSPDDIADILKALNLSIEND